MRAAQHSIDKRRRVFRAGRSALLAATLAAMRSRRRILFGVKSTQIYCRQVVGRGALERIRYFLNDKRRRARRISSPALQADEIPRGSHRAARAQVLESDLDEQINVGVLARRRELQQRASPAFASSGRRQRNLPPH